MNSEQKMYYNPGRMRLNVRFTSTETEPSWNRFEDNKAFLTGGRGLQHWGSRSEIIRFESHDVGISMNVFGQVLIDSLLVNCRSANSGQITRNQGCLTDKCSIRDASFWRGFTGIYYLT